MAKKDNTPAYREGDLGGRGPHPALPELGPKHWPLAQPHERVDHTGKTAGRLGPVVTPPAITPSAAEARETAVKHTSSTTGLLTREDFMAEAVRLGVSSAELNTKIAIAFRDAPNEGMRRMRAGNLLRHAIKKARAAT